eukprot:m.133456 g.133456  ORF g.133456 m.133456 type:complete len:119 (+) comp14673_c1_seq2:4703-5059(+)
MQFKGCLQWYTIINFVLGDSCQLSAKPCELWILSRFHIVMEFGYNFQSLGIEEHDRKFDNFVWVIAHTLKYVFSSPTCMPTLLPSSTINITSSSHVASKSNTHMKSILYNLCQSKRGE